MPISVCHAFLILSLLLLFLFYSDSCIWMPKENLTFTKRFFKWFFFLTYMWEFLIIEWHGWAKIQKSFSNWNEVSSTCNELHKAMNIDFTHAKSNYICSPMKSANNCYIHLTPTNAFPHPPKKMCTYQNIISIFNTEISLHTSTLSVIPFRTIKRPSETINVRLESKRFWAQA